MIAFIRGVVLAKTESAIIVENNDLGYEVRVPVMLWRKAKVGEAFHCFTHEYIREDARELFGFASLEELAFFRKLISVSGVGPKLALAALSVGTLRDVQTAIAVGNVTLLTAIPGIGTKSAQKIILELKGKLNLTEGAGPGDREAIEALQGLGYSQAQVQEALRRVPGDVEDVGERVRAALKVLGQKVAR